MLRLLVLSDTHLGLDDPAARARIVRRRRGPDFLAMMERALEPARRGAVDLVVHGGDLLYRSRVSPALVAEAVAPLRQVAEAGVPVVVVPGNHERSRLPYPLLVRHRRIFVLDRPRTLLVEAAGQRVALAGWPHADDVRARFATLLAETRWADAPAKIRLLCLHQVVEGARVGQPEFTFRGGPEVIRAAALPRTGFAAVLSGHVHRAQVLRRALDGSPLGAPVLYPGSVERTSFAEREEAKGYLLLELAPGPAGGRLVEHRFVELPARPMLVLELAATELADRSLLRQRLAALDPDAVVQLRAPGSPPIRAAELRALAPPSMNIELRVPRAL